MNRWVGHFVSGIVALVFIASCEGANTASGTLIVTAHGGVEAREGIPVTRMRDGYAIHYRHVVLELEELRLEARDGDSAAISVTPVVVELVPTAAEAFRVQGIPPRRWDAVRFSSRPVPEGARVADGVDPDIVTRMREEGWSFYLEGTLVGPAPPDGEEEEIPFAFGMPVAIDYLDCASGDGTLGIVIAPNAVTEAEITWHLTHTWFDSFVEDAALRAEAFAAAWDGEGALEIRDLEAQLLSRMRGVRGSLLVDEVGNPVQYLPGMTGARTLREFVLSHRYGHWNGLEGLCRTELRILE